MKHLVHLQYNAILGQPCNDNPRRLTGKMQAAQRRSRRKHPARRGGIRLALHASMPAAKMTGVNNEENGERSLEEGENMKNSALAGWRLAK